MTPTNANRPADPGRPGDDAPPPSPRIPRFRRVSPAWVLVVAVLLGLNFWAGQQATQPPPRVRIPYSPFFLDKVNAGKVAQIMSKGTTIQGMFTDPQRYQGSGPTKLFNTEIPAFADTNELSSLLERKNVVVNAEPLDVGAPWWETLLVGFGPTVLLLGLLFLLFRRMGSGGGALASFGRSRARRYQPSEQRVTFADVAGIDEAKQELTEVVDYLRNPQKYQRLGGRIPRGVLLSGPPGTGKTLLAQAVAGEAEVPFFSMAASEFVEAIVGVGASRVRDLFVQAKAAAPSIVFIDELDAIGRSRTAGLAGFGGSDEREQTLNQILTEMDGFDSSTSVIVIAATNRPDVLDPALLRPGRFDRRVAVQAPDRKGRRQILEVHTRSVPLGPDVDLDRIASTTPGMVGAELANLVNEAALLAARRDHDQVMMADFTGALERIVLGAERKLMMSQEDRRLTAYHEAGHAVVGMLTPGADPVRKISIVPRGRALGVTFSAPEDDRYNYEHRELIAKIDVALGGRVAEEIVFGETTTGAESDIEQLTDIARHMVGRWGMSEAVGPVAVIPREATGPMLPGASEVSEQMHELVDTEVRRIVDAERRQVVTLLTEHRGKLDSLAEALLDRETLDEEEAYAIAGVTRSHVDEGPREREVAAAATVRADPPNADGRRRAPGE